MSEDTQKITLFGRFRLMPRAEIEQALAERGIRTVKDLTRQTSMLAVGVGATNLISRGVLIKRLTEARERDIPVLSERRLLDWINGAIDVEATLQLSHVAKHASDTLVDLLNAFGLISLVEGKVRFEDVDALRNASDLEARGMEPTQIIEALTLRATAPIGRHRVGVDALGRAVLEWGDIQTTLSGQGMLPLDDFEVLDDLFDAALEAEANGDLITARRHYETCARADRRDAIALFNLGNVCMDLGDERSAQLAFERAIARDPNFAEARFNLAGVLEALGKQRAALIQLKRTLDVAPDYADALFNLAQLELATGDIDAAEALFKKYVSLAGSDVWREKARKALQLIKLRRSLSRSGTASEIG